LLISEKINFYTSGFITCSEKDADDVHIQAIEKKIVR